MAARRLIAVLIALLAVSTVLAVLAPAPDVDDDDAAEDERSEPIRTEGRGEDGLAGPASPARRGEGELVSMTIDARPGARPERIRIEPGDQLRLSVRAPQFDQVELVGLGIVRDVSVGSPARFDILPFEPGRHPVRLLEAERDVGVVEVVRRR